MFTREHHTPRRCDRAVPVRASFIGPNLPALVTPLQASCPFFVRKNGFERRATALFTSHVNGIGFEWQSRDVLPILTPMSAACSIRPYVEDDWLALFEAVKESLAELGPWMPWAHPTYSKDDAKQWVQSTIEGHSVGTFFDFAVFDADGRYLGACGVNQIQKDYRCANLGYWIRTSANGRGFAASAALDLCDWTFRHTNLDRLEILVAVDNVRSKRVAEKTGAMFEGRLRCRLPLHGTSSDAFVFSIVRGDRPHLPL